MFFYNKKNFKYILYFIFFNFYFYASENPNDEVYPNIFNANASAEGEKDLLDEKYKQLKGKNPFTEKEQIVFDGITKGLRFIGGHFFEKEKFKEFEKKNNFEKLNIVSSCINLLIVKKTDWLKKKLPNETQILLSNFIEISKNNSQTTIQDYLLSYFSNIIAAKHFHKKTDFYCFNFSDFDGTNKEFTEYDSELKQQIALNYSLFNHIKESLIRYDRSFFDECLLNKSYKEFIETISL